jgi:type I restriction-modification system DNA methylase subunit
MLTKEKLNRFFEKVNDIIIKYPNSKNEFADILLAIFVSSFKGKGNSMFRKLNSDNGALLLEKDIFEYLKSSLSDLTERIADIDLINHLKIDTNPFFEKALGEIYYCWTEFYFLIDWKDDDIIALFDDFESWILTSYEYHTPKEIVSFCSSLSPIFPNTSIYDPYLRTGNFYTALHSKYKFKNTFFGYSNSHWGWKVAKLKFFILGLENDIRLGSPFYDNSNKKYDYILTNPPFGIQDKNIIEHGNDGFWFNTFSSNRSELNFTLNALDHLSEKGRATIIVPTGFLSNRSNTQNFRESAINQNIIEGIIILPHRIFQNTKVKTAIIVFNKSKKTDKVILFDLSNVTTDSDEFTTLPSIQLQKFRNGDESILKEIKHLTKIISQEQIKKNNYDLNISLHEGSFELEPKYTPSQEFWERCLTLESNLKSTQEQIALLVSKFKKD